MTQQEQASNNNNKQQKSVLENMPLEKLSKVLEVYYSFVKICITPEERRLAVKTLEKLQNHHENILSKKMLNDANNITNYRHKINNYEYTEKEKEEIMKLIESV